MPRRSKGPRLWLRPGRHDRDGKHHGAIYVILDRGRQIATGCGVDQAEQAERILAEYITQKHHRDVGKRDPTQIPVADVLSVYLDDVVDKHARPDDSRRRIARIADFFGSKLLSDTQWRAAISKNCAPLSTIIGEKGCTIVSCQWYCRHVGRPVSDGWIEVRLRNYFGRHGGDRSANNLPGSFCSRSTPAADRPWSVTHRFGASLAAHGLTLTVAAYGRRSEQREPRNAIHHRASLNDCCRTCGAGAIRGTATLLNGAMAR